MIEDERGNASPPESYKLMDQEQLAAVRTKMLDAYRGKDFIRAAQHYNLTHKIEAAKLNTAVPISTIMTMQSDRRKLKDQLQQSNPQAIKQVAALMDAESDFGI